MANRKPFLSDNAAKVHPQVWEAMRAADAADVPYDGDALSAQLDERFTALFGRECAAIWVATGTAANCLALGTMVQPHGGVVCHEEAHVELDEGGAPGFFLHGAKLMLASDSLGGKSAKLTPPQIAALIDPIRDDVHQVQPHAIAITQASEYGCVYREDELAALSEFSKARGLGLHMDGARFANAAAFLDGSASKAAGLVDSLAFGCIKNGAMSAECVILFDPEQAAQVKYRRKRAGHLQCKGRYLAAQILAMLDGDLWLANARAANGAATQIASGCGERLLHPVEANEVFARINAQEREALRGQGFDFYDWGAEIDGGAARFVASWDSAAEDAEALGKAIAAL